MQKSFKRTLSLLLAVVIAAAVLTIAPLSASAAEGEPEIAGTSITLNGAIGLNFYVKENGNTEYTPSFSFSEDLIYTDSEPTSNLFDDPVYDATNTYRIYTINVFAKQMTEEVTFCVSETETKTTSVREYAEKIITGECDAALAEQGYSAEKIAKAKELCMSMLNYGAQAQVEFHYLTDDLANKNYSDYTAPAPDPASIQDIDYTNPDGAWIVESSRAYQFVNTFDWEHVYVHYLFDAEITEWYDNDQYWEVVNVFCDDIVEEIFPSEYTYTNAYSDTDISNGKTIYIFKPTQEFRYLVFTDTPDNLNGQRVYSDCQYAYFIHSQYDTSAGWKNWVNGEENSCETFYDSSVHFIDFVNKQKWDAVSADIITSEWVEPNGFVETSHVYPMTKLSEKAADGSDVYRLILPEEFTGSNSDITIKFTNGTEETIKTKYYTDNNIHRYTPSQRTDRFEKFGMTYSGSSIGLLQKIGYSLFFLDLDRDTYNSVELFYGEATDYDHVLYSELDPQYQELGYSCYPIRNIAPSDLLKPIKVTFKWYDEESIEQTETVEFTVCNYIKRALMLDDSNDNNVQLKKTVTALVDYAEKADAYFNAN